MRSPFSKSISVLAAMAIMLCTSLAAEESLLIANSDSLPFTDAPVGNFTGRVRVQVFFGPEAPSRTAGASVTFDPGARSDWHTHDYGQTLIVTAGAGRVQRWGGPVQEIHVGDVIYTPPGVRHWHGASPEAAMTHVSIVERPDSGSGTTWLEDVTDDQYNGASEAPAPAAADFDSADDEPSRAQQLMGDIAPQLAELTDDVLYGQVWADPTLSRRDRSLVTVSALIALNREAQLRSHLALALRNGVTQDELIGAITHLAFYSGWPNSVTAVKIAREVFESEETP